MVDHHAADAELLERAQRHGRAPSWSSSDWSTIWPFQPRFALLHRDQLQVIRIDLRHQQRHVLLHAVVLGIRDHNVAGLGEGALDLSGDGRIHGREHQARRALPGLQSSTVRSAWLRACSRPGASWSLRDTSCRPSGRSRPPRSRRTTDDCEELDEVLAHHSGAAEDSDGDSIFGCAYLDLHWCSCLIMFL